jgi:CsoR family transcriptional regulator, copper-sensing transcriptional repressor
MPKGHPKDNSEEQKILHQLKIARGHLNKVIKMKEEGAYCVDVVHQSIAVQSALRKIDQKILKSHMESCVADAIRRGNDKEVIDEVMSVMEKL